MRLQHATQERWLVAMRQRLASLNMRVCETRCALPGAHLQPESLGPSSPPPPTRLAGNLQQRLMGVEQRPQGLNLSSGPRVSAASPACSFSSDPCVTTGSSVTTAPLSQSLSSEDAWDQEPIPPGNTTIVVHNIPGRCTKDELLSAWPPAQTGIDYLYVPFNIWQRRTSGYVFVNFTSWEAAELFRAQWHGRSFTSAGKTKRLGVAVAKVQGFIGNIRYILDSNVLAIQNEKYLPTVFRDGRRVNLRELIASLFPGSCDRTLERTSIGAVATLEGTSNVARESVAASVQPGDGHRRRPQLF